MIEIFPNISQQARLAAEIAFNQAAQLTNPIAFATALNNFTLKQLKEFPEENLEDFLQFYFNMRLEALMNDNSNSIG